MGDKIESKKLAKAAGVNVVPGFLGEIAIPTMRSRSPAASAIR
jgi:acetyl/propionyl-CoA carboxylase alpha subunit